MLYHMNGEAQAGRDAFVEQRPPDFRRLPRRP
jgi:1,4-dihydroxy-2-naphthoyl-CoA synthase